MSLSEERMQVLKMVEAGTISADEGARLLAAMEERTAFEPVSDSSSKPRWMHVLVKDLTTGNPKVNVKIPIGLVGVGIKMGAQFIPGTQGVDMQGIVDAVKEGIDGKVTEVEDLESNELVEIYIE